MKQQTLRAPVRFAGVGLHTGVEGCVEVRPASTGSGLTFVLGGGVRVPATAEFVTETARATVIGRDGASVSTTEHLLSALFAGGIDNAEILVEGPEIPVLDGSAREFSTAFERVGLLEQRAERVTLELDRPHVTQEGDALIAFFPSDRLRIRFVADFKPPIGTQYFDGAIDPGLFRDEIAAARTFGYLHEVEALRARGLALGGSLDNALVFAPEGPMQTLRWPNEVVRHKVLDLIGDLALLGAWPQCDVLAIKSGHRLHALATRALRARLNLAPVG